MWWPSLNVDIETVCSRCLSCAKVNFKRKNAYVGWLNAKYQFGRVHVDFFYLKTLKLTFLIFCYAYSKWLHVQIMDTTSARAVIDVLFSSISMWVCLPTTLVSDNGPPFDSEEFLYFCSKFDIASNRIPPYHPESNSLGERGVLIAKRWLDKIFSEVNPGDQSHPASRFHSCSETIVSKVNLFLFNHHNTPSTVTMKSPNEMFLRFKPKTLSTMLNPQIHSNSSLPNTIGDFRERGSIIC